MNLTVLDPLPVNSIKWSENKWRNFHKVVASSNHGRIQRCGGTGQLSAGNTPTREY